ncbi:hypothetical protein E2C01_052839 [Portunus trituberculatus]|uniref:Uncharacterized protein n=1 Tax=Portunus trituberculatus TaxID=210409 RepID=A0A5B7GP98_PORTR|nr:hypothetical protein [Portunus trituberculatus]
MSMEMCEEEVGDVVHLMQVANERLLSLITDKGKEHFNNLEANQCINRPKSLLTDCGRTRDAHRHPVHQYYGNTGITSNMV